MWTPAPEAEEHVPQVGREKTRRWWCHGAAGEPLCTGEASAEGPCENAHHDSGKQSERRKEGGLRCLLHGGGDHRLLRLQCVLIGVMALSGPASGGRSTAVSLAAARPASPKATVDALTVLVLAMH